MKKIWPFSFYFLYFASFSALLPYIVLFYQALHFSGAQIGLLAGVPALVTLVCAPFLAGVADSTHRHRAIMGIGIAIPVVVMGVMPSMSSFVIVFALIILFNVFLAPVAPLADSATMGMLGEERAMYGRIRMGGAIGWGIFALIAGKILDAFGVRALFYVSAAIMLINLFVSRKFSFNKPDEHSSDKGSIRVLLASRRWIFFLLAALLGGVAATTVAAFLSPYMQELGASGNQIGIAITIATFTELPVFYLGDRLVKRFGSYRLLMISLALVGLRSLFYAAVDSIPMVYVVQIFSGAMFPAMWVAGVAYADEHSPAGLKSTGQGLFGATMFGFGSAVGGFIGGLLLESIGGRRMFFVFGIAILVGLALIEGIKRLLPKEETPPTILKTKNPP